MGRVVMRFKFGGMVCTVFLLVACASAPSIGKKDFSQGVDVEVLATKNTPTYHITSNVGSRNTGNYYLLRREYREWQVISTSPTINNLFQQVDEKVTFLGSEVIWSDGKTVTPYFGSNVNQLKIENGTFKCPRRGEGGHRACESKLTKPVRTYDQLPVETGQLLYEFNYDEIIKAVHDTGILRTKK